MVAAPDMKTPPKPTLTRLSAAVVALIPLQGTTAGA
jgi:hypothetical protein